MPSLMVSVPTFDRSLKSLTAESIGNAVERASGMLDGVVYKYAGGYSVARARNIMAQRALDAGVDCILMVDSDMVVPEDGLERLLSHDLEVCTGWAVRGTSDTGQTSVIKPGTQGFHDSYMASEIASMDGLFEVKGNGMAFALINTDVFRRFKRPWFKYVDYPNGSALGEDYYFCQQCAQNGVKVWVDPNVGCGHIHDRVLEAR